MNSTLLHRQHGRSIFWIAFVTALAIHLGAVALAKTKSPIRKLEDFSPPADAVLVEMAAPASALPEESVTPPPLEQIHPDQNNFPEENLTTPPPVRAHQRARPSPLCHRNNGVIACRKSDGRVCATPGLSVRSAASTTHRIRRRVAHG